MGRCGLSNATSTGPNTIHSEKTPGKLGATDSRAATVLSSLEKAPPLHTTGSGHRPQSRQHEVKGSKETLLPWGQRCWAGLVGHSQAGGTGDV